jgi:hypothetical protein
MYLMSAELFWSLGLIVGMVLGVPVGLILAQDGTLRVILAAIRPADDRGK